jgi:hypothetical protein
MSKRPQSFAEELTRAIAQSRPPRHLRPQARRAWLWLRGRITFSGDVDAGADPAEVRRLILAGFGRVAALVAAAKAAKDAGCAMPPLAAEDVWLLQRFGIGVPSLFN